MRPLLIAKSALISLAAITPAIAEENTLPESLSLYGDISAVSQYVSRGLQESEHPAIQGSLTIEHDSGLYAGWWGSNISYSYDKSRLIPYDADGSGFENDLYLGYYTEFGDTGLSLDVGVYQYLYVNVDDSNQTEAYAVLGFEGLELTAQYMVREGWWGNTGDLYLAAGYGIDLPYNFNLSALLGWFIYDDDDNSKMCEDCTQENDAFRHLDVVLTYPIMDTGAEVFAQYTFAGEDRESTELDDQMLIGAIYYFDF